MQAKSDAKLLRDYAERGADSAFRELVTRHTNFVYSSALRQVEASAVAADITQGVFVDLARKAGSVCQALLPEASLAGWLHRSTRYAALNYLRDTRRRRENERQAMEQLLTNSESAADWEQIRPALDEALDQLGDEDREALLLRYFKNQDFRAAGLALGVSDDVAQKRVSRAVERLREFFAKRVVTVGASGLVVLITANAVQAAPVGLAVAISAAALAGTAATTSTLIAATAKTIAMTTLQKTLVTATVAVLTGAGLYEARQAGQLRDQVQTLQQQQAPLAEQIQQLQKDKSDLAGRLVNVADDLAKRNGNSNELLKLRGEVGMLRQQNKQLDESLRSTISKPQPDPAEKGAHDATFTRDAWTFVGYETPEDAFQSSAWAVSKGDAKTFLDNITPEFRTWLEAGLKSQDEAVIEGLNGIETATKSYRITNVQTNSGTERILFVWQEDAYGNSHGAPMLLKKIDGKWKIGRLAEKSPK